MMSLVGDRVRWLNTLAMMAMALLVSVATGMALSAWAHAEGCSSVTEQVREQQAQARSPFPPLPDCRAYEQVSPTAKNGGEAAGTKGLVKASPAGGKVTYFSRTPFPGTRAASQAPSYVGVRDSGGWSTRGLEALASPSTVEFAFGLTEDLSKTMLAVASRQEGCPPPPQEEVEEVCGSGNYIGDNSTGRFQFIVNTEGDLSLEFADATPGGSHILLETESKLTPDATAGRNLYVWDESKPTSERLRLAGILPGGEPPTEGSVAGPGGPTVPRLPINEEENPYYAQNTISIDGSRIFFSDLGTGVVYMREPAASRTIQVSSGPGPAFWRAATTDGSYIFYTEGQDLYRFNVSRFTDSKEPEPVALAEAREQLTTGAEGVFGVLGIAETDGSYVYFAAPGVLAANQNGRGEEAVSGAENVYEWHNGQTTFIVQLSDGQSEMNWTPRVITNNVSFTAGPSAGERTSRVTPDGTELLISAGTALTSYNNNGLNEFYLYNSELPLSTTNPTCVSCNPRGTLPTGEGPRLTANRSGYLVPPKEATMEHNLSSHGGRVLFETEEALVLGDANPTVDVYEWEANGVGSCRSEGQDNGCLYLISTGRSPQPAYFGDASADGNDVFFFTSQQLAGQDEDEVDDIYDARAEGGIPAQNPLPPPPPCAQETACRVASFSTPSAFGTPASTTFSGPGNLTSVLASPQHTRHLETRSQKLTKALKTCRAKRKRQRRSCEAAARLRYGPSHSRAKKTRAKKTQRRGGGARS
jgi:hypothetical protein